MVQEVPTLLEQPHMTVELLPLRPPPEGLWVQLEVFQLGRSLGCWQLRQSGALREIDIRLPLPAGRPGKIATLRVRTNSELQLVC